MCLQVFGKAEYWPTIRDCAELRILGIRKMACSYKLASDDRILASLVGNTRALNCEHKPFKIRIADAQGLTPVIAWYAAPSINLHEHKYSRP